MTRHCSIPDIFNLRKWFEKNFGKACAYHDDCYTHPKLTRFEADMYLTFYMFDATISKSSKSKIFIYWPTILLTFLLVRCFGWIRYKR